jgi:hypothetical protein
MGNFTNTGIDTATGLRDALELADHGLAICIFQRDFQF